MQQTQTDTLGRATFHHIKQQPDVRPTAREIRWFKHIERHGPQSSHYLYELTKDTHRCKDTALRQMQKLRAGGYLSLPRQQRATERAEFNPYIYDLTKKSLDYLFDLGIAEPTVRPTGHWWHGFWTAVVTGSWDLCARRKGEEYIPGHKILARNNASLPIPIGSKILIPDQFFAVKYPDGYRAFLLELDRGTEPLKSAKARKTLKRSIQLYREMFATDAHRRHYGLRATTIVLWVFENSARMVRFNELVRTHAGEHTQRFLSKTLPNSWRWSDMLTFQEAPWIGCSDEVEKVSL